MSRRFIFLLSVTVVMLYFSIIMFMLNPLHSARGVYSDLNGFRFRRNPKIEWCQKLSWTVPPKPEAVALVSAPGSGNTWARYLLQQATGVLTGSVYLDPGLRTHGFPAENVTDGSVLVIKTHELPPRNHDKFKLAIMIVRNPRDSILAEYNRIHRGHTGTVPRAAFQDHMFMNRLDLNWNVHFETFINKWENLHLHWLTDFRGPIHFVFYEDLVSDTEKVLLGILKFLNFDLKKADISCALKNREGIYRRLKKQDFDPYSLDMYKRLTSVKNKIYRLILVPAARQPEVVPAVLAARRGAIRQPHHAARLLAYLHLRCTTTSAAASASASATIAATCHLEILSLV